MLLMAITIHTRPQLVLLFDMWFNITIILKVNNKEVVIIKQLNIKFMVIKLLNTKFIKLITVPI